MNRVDQAIQVLSKTEGDLRTLVREAAAEGDYADVVQLASWAKAVAQLLGPEPSPKSTSPVLAIGRAEATPTNSPKSAAHAHKRAQSTGYPRFYRDGDRLVRVAWSKRERKEYEHRAPWSVLSALVKAVSQMGTKGRLFTTEQLLPLMNDHGEHIPDYQAYLVLSLVRHVGLVDQHGRRGYSVPKPTDLITASERIWKNLPER